MTEPLIKLPSVIVEEMLAERLAEEMAKVKSKVLADQQVMLASKAAEIAAKDAEIQRLRELVSQLSSDKLTL